MLKKLKDKYKSAPLEIQKKVPALFATILLILFFLIVLSTAVLISGEYVRGLIELGAALLFSSSLFLLSKGRYEGAANLVIFFALLVLGFFAFTVEPSNAYASHKVAFYMLPPVVLYALLGISPIVLRLLGGLQIITVGSLFFFRILPNLPSDTRAEGISQFIVSFFLSAISFVMLDRLTQIAKTLIREAVMQEEENAVQLQDLAKLLEQSYDNLNISQQMDLQIAGLTENVTATVDTTGEVGKSLNTFENLFGKTMEAVGVIGDQIEELHHQILRQNSSQEQSSASVTEMVANIQSVADVVARKQSTTERLIQSAVLGREKLNSTSTLIAESGTSMGRIREALTVIADIASQTNLLSMNAAIEAAHAGDSGRGFAVVAEEIRKLAETSAENVGAITGVINEVSQRMDKMVQSSGDTTRAFEEIQEEVEGVTHALREIEASTQELTAGGSQILSAMEELQSSSTQVHQGSLIIQEAQQEVHRNIGETRSSSNQIISAVGGISATHEKMRSSLEEFQILTGKLGRACVNLYDSANRSVKKEDN